MTNTPEVDVSAMRREYARVGLSEGDLEATWLAQFEHWLRDTVAAELPEPNAMILATATAEGRPSARTVLLKGLDARGFVFFTNLTSRKGTELAENPYASLVFPWHPIGRQVVVAGRVTQIDRADTEAYFAGRPRDSQLGAWASPQSRVVAGRDVLDEALAEQEQRFADTESPPPPAQWGGLRVVPDTVEFWQGRVGRLHDRLRFRREATVRDTEVPDTEVPDTEVPDTEVPDIGAEAWVVERLGP